MKIKPNEALIRIALVVGLFCLSPLISVSREGKTCYVNVLTDEHMYSHDGTGDCWENESDGCSPSMPIDCSAWYYDEFILFCGGTALEPNPPCLLCTEIKVPGASTIKRYAGLCDWDPEQGCMCFVTNFDQPLESAPSVWVTAWTTQDCEECPGPA